MEDDSFETKGVVMGEKRWVLMSDLFCLFLVCVVVGVFYFCEGREKFSFWGQNNQDNESHYQEERAGKWWGTLIASEPEIMIPDDFIGTKDGRECTVAIPIEADRSTKGYWADNESAWMAEMERGISRLRASQTGGWESIHPIEPEWKNHYRFDDTPGILKMKISLNIAISITAKNGEWATCSKNQRQIVKRSINLYTDEVLLNISPEERIHAVYLDNNNNN